MLGFTYLYYSTNQVMRNLWQQRFLSLLTIIVIACSTTLPTFSYLLWKNSQLVEKYFPNLNHHVILFLKPDISTSTIRKLLNDLNKQKFVEKVEYISPAEGLNIIQNSDFNLAELTSSALPKAVIVQLKDSQKITNFHRIRQKLSQMAGVEEVNWDEVLWQKINAVTSLLAKIFWINLGLTLLTLIFIISYSVRSEVFYQKKQIEVMQLLGATKNFIVLPFLIRSIWFMGLGTFIGCGISALALRMLNSNTLVLKTLYQLPFRLTNLNPFELASFVLISTLLGYLCTIFTTLGFINDLDSPLIQNSSVSPKSRPTRK